MDIFYVTNRSGYSDSKLDELIRVGYQMQGNDVSELCIVHSHQDSGNHIYYSCGAGEVVPLAIEFPNDTHYNINHRGEIENITRCLADERESDEIMRQVESERNSYIDDSYDSDTYWDDVIDYENGEL